uniref:Uncharacterized protein n=1 Tax=Arion vulgaris TaxID=1028688 RepID=A0A0B6Z2Y5_9EUPU
MSCTLSLKMSHKCRIFCLPALLLVWNIYVKDETEGINWICQESIPPIFWL